MIVRVSYSTEVDDDFRRAINLFYGQDGLATRQEVKDWFKSYGDSENDNLMYALQQAEAESDEEPDSDG